MPFLMALISRRRHTICFSGACSSNEFRGLMDSFARGYERTYSLSRQGIHIGRLFLFPFDDLKEKRSAHLIKSSDIRRFQNLYDTLAENRGNNPSSYINFLLAADNRISREKKKTNEERTKEN